MNNYIACLPIKDLCILLQKKLLEEEYKDEKYKKYIESINNNLSELSKNILLFIESNYKTDDNYFCKKLDIDNLTKNVSNRNLIRTMTKPIDKANYKDILNNISKKLSYFKNRINKDQKLDNLIDNLLDDIVLSIIKQRKAWNIYKLNNNKFNKNNKIYNNYKNNNYKNNMYTLDDVHFPKLGEN
jgi:hypothetical protein